MVDTLEMLIPLHVLSDDLYIMFIILYRLNKISPLSFSPFQIIFDHIKKSRFFTQIFYYILHLDLH